MRIASRLKRPGDPSVSFAVSYPTITHDQRRRRMTAALIAILLLFAFPLAAQSIGPCIGLGQGVVVESVAKGSDAERAGLAVGDTILSWSQGDRHGSITSPFEFAAMEFEVAPRGEAVFEGSRGTASSKWLLKAEKWGAKVRPNLPLDLLARYTEGLQLAKAGETGKAMERWRTAIGEAGPLGCSWLRPWMAARAAEVLAGMGQWKQADEFYQTAAEAADGNPQIGGQIHQDWARTFLARGDLGTAGEHYRQALALRERSVPESMEMAASLTNLGNVAMIGGDSTAAQELHRRALAIRARLAPSSLATAASLNNLGGIASDRGDLAQAQEYLSQALQIRERLAPGTLDLAASLGNMGILAFSRGDFAAAEKYLRENLAITEKLAPDSLDMSGTLGNLGAIAYERGDIVQAEEYQQKASAILERLAPASGYLAKVLGNLGNLAAERGDLAQSEMYQRKALEILEKTAPGSTYVAMSLQNLADVFIKRGDLAQAESYVQQSLAMLEKAAPSTLAVAAAGSGLGDLASRRSDLEQAEKYYRSALEIEDRLAPGSKLHAESLAGLAGVMKARGKPDAAAELYRRALDAFESQTARLGGSGDVRSAFRARHTIYYRDYFELLMEQKQPERAFEVLERSRARSLLETLGEAHAEIRRGIDPALLEEERTVGATLRIKMEQRFEGKLKEPAEIDSLLAHYGEIQGRIRTSSPSYAALTQPQPLDLKSVQRELLDEPTMLLEYALGREHSYVFAVTASTLRVYELPTGAEIESAARDLYEALRTRGADKGGHGAPKESYASISGRLSAMLLGPVAPTLGTHRLVIVAEGALQYIPFGALPAPGAGGAPLLAEHEITSLPSASVLAGLRQELTRRGAVPPKAVAVLADPVFDKDDRRVKREQASASGPAVIGAPGQFRLTRSVEDAGLRSADPYTLPRLAFSRQEAEAIISLAGGEQAFQALDFEANRSTATRADLSQYRIVHFATHGLLDSRRPEFSGLVLSLVDERGNPRDGFLDLQDIYNLNLPIDLVVLSACETALGKDVSGEGLVGLTRGFMHAGAPRVVASLWKVDDVATAELIEKFYRAMLKEGKPPAAALRSAQLAMSIEKRWSAPYFWAGFIFEGEWR
jgi:CHAT domain-containing protein/Tfp pilus assembly protein PilF